MADYILGFKFPQRPSKMAFYRLGTFEPSRTASRRMAS